MLVPVIDNFDLANGGEIFTQQLYVTKSRAVCEQMVSEAENGSSELPKRPEHLYIGPMLRHRKS